MTQSSDFSRCFGAYSIDRRMCRSTYYGLIARELCRSPGISRILQCIGYLWKKECFKWWRQEKKKNIKVKEEQVWIIITNQIILFLSNHKYVHVCKVRPMNKKKKKKGYYSCISLLGLSQHIPTSIVHFAKNTLLMGLEPAISVSGVPRLRRPSHWAG